MLLLLELDGGRGGVGEAAPAFETMHLDCQAGGFTSGEGGGPFAWGFVGSFCFQAEDEGAVFIVPVAFGDGALVIHAHVGGQFGSGFHDREPFGFHAAGIDRENDHVFIELPFETEFHGVAVIGGAFPAAEHPAGVSFIGEAGQGDLGFGGEGEGAGQRGDRDES